MALTAISDDFLTAYARIPKRAQKKVREFTSKFRQDPTSSGINYEKLSGKVDGRLRSVRVGIDYRAIVLTPQQGDVYVLLWVDHHDEAYDWAKKRRVEVHPATGALQVYKTYEAIAPVLAEQPATDHARTRFHDFSDDELFSAGVPRPLMPAVRAIYTDDDLDALAPHLPSEAAEVLTGLAAGMSLDEVLEEVLGGTVNAGRPEQTVDTADVAAALVRVESSRRFRVLDDEFDLERALDYPLDKWRVFLHPSQRRLVERPTKGPTRVLGAAGTGKTVVAMHRAVELVRRHLAPDEGVLFTTFTVNLAEEIAAQLSKIAEPDALSRISVISIDTLASRLAKEGGIDLRLAFDTSKLWTEAVDIYGEGPWGLEFYRAEWKDVLQAQNITDEATYLKARRMGRGTKLRRTERRKVWPVFERYRELLDERGLAETDDLLRIAKRVVDADPGAHRFAAVVVDEAQDMSAPALELIRELAGPEHANDVFLVGDAHQRIYGRPVSLLACGINIRGRRSRRLRINYRTTDAIRRFSMRVLESETFDDLGDGTDDAKGYVSLRSGPDPEVHLFDDLAAERAFLVGEIQRLIKSGTPPHHICVAARTHEQIENSYEPALRGAGIAVAKLGRTRPNPEGVRIGTMHRIKGLEFPVVILAGVDRGHMPLSTPELEAPDPVVAAHAMKRERCLFYVAASRARDRLVVSASGTPSPFLRGKATGT